MISPRQVSPLSKAPSTVENDFTSTTTSLQILKNLQEAIQIPSTPKNDAGENDANFLPVFYPKKLRKNSKEDFTKLTTTNVQNEDDNKIQTSTTTEIQKSSTTENPNNKIVSKTNNHLQLSKVQSTMEKQPNVRENTKKPKDEIEKVETNLPPIINSLKKASPLVSNTKPTKQIIFFTVRVGT